MVRVYFLIEAKQERIHCLLNPEGLVIRRQAGIQPRRSATGQLTGVGLEDDPLLFTGGGRTQLDLDLLFDVALSGSSIKAEDVRSLTRPLWQLAENSSREGDNTRPPLVRFIWGKSWNIPGYVTAVAERLERFTPDGIPQRSWLRLRFVRASEAAYQDIKVKKYPSLAGITLAQGARSTESGETRPSSVPVKTTTLSGGPATPPSPLRPAPEEDLGLTSSVVLAADIIAFSLANTHAGRLIGQGIAWMGGRLELAGSLIADWVKSVGASIANFAQTAAGKLAAFLNKAIAPIKAQIKVWMDPPPSAFMQKIKRGAGKVWAALGGVFNRLKNAATAVEKALAKVLGPVFEDIRDTLSGVMAATWVVAKAVKAKAAQVLSSASKRIGALSAKIGAAFQSAFQKMPGLMQRMGAGIQAALAVIGGALAKVKLNGSIADFHLIPDALAKIAGTVKDLVAGGARGAAKIVRKSVEAIARALHNTFAAREAADAVSKTETIQQVSTSHEQISSTLQELKTNPDPAKVEQAQAAFADLRGQVQFLQADPELAEPPAKEAAPLEPVVAEPVEPGVEPAIEPAVEPVTQPGAGAVLEPAPLPIPLAPIPAQVFADLQAAVPAMEELQPGQEETVLAAVSPPLKALSAALETVRQGEAEQTQAQFQAAARQEEPDQPAVPYATRPRMGDRLDQVAYEQYGDPAFWRLLAAFNEISDIFHIPSGQPLAIPPATILEAR
jgi:hypothetical protein